MIIQHRNSVVETHTNYKTGNGEMVHVTITAPSENLPDIHYDFFVGSIDNSVIRRDVAHYCFCSGETKQWRGKVTPYEDEHIRRKRIPFTLSSGTSHTTQVLNYNAAHPYRHSG